MSKADWQDDCPDIKSRTRVILTTKLGADCEFLVGPELNQKKISGHKIILAMASPTFENNFYKGFTDEKIIKVPDIDPEIFQMMMNFIYTDEVQIQSIDDSIDLFYVAKKYLIKRLVRLCSDYIIRHLNTSNVCKVYEYASLFEESYLKKHCLQLISARTKKILIDDSLFEIKPSTLSTIFSLDQLNIDSELDLLQALNSYAVINGYLAQLKTDESSGSKKLIDTQKIDKVRDFQSPERRSGNDTVLENNRRPSKNQNEAISEQDKHLLHAVSHTTNAESNKNINDLKPIVKMIRFLSLTAEEFSKISISSEFLNDSDALTLIMNILNPSCTRSIPEGFCSYRIKRNTPTQIELPKTNHKRIAKLPENCHVDDAPIVVSLYNNYFSNNFAINCPTKLKEIKIKQQTMDFEMFFDVDTDILVTGVEIPAQRCAENSSATLGSKKRYTESLNVYLLDDRDAQLSYVHITRDTIYDSFISISFPEPVLIQGNRMYQIGISFNTPGCYPMYTCYSEVKHKNAHFMFYIESPDNSLRAGLIREIIYTPLLP